MDHILNHLVRKENRLLLTDPFPEDPDSAPCFVTCVREDPVTPEPQRKLPGKITQTYDAAFKRIMELPCIYAAIIRQLHPDFHQFSAASLVDCADKEHPELLALRDGEIWQGSHVMRADRIASFHLPLPDSEGIMPSRYLVNIEMQREQQTPYSLQKRAVQYAAGLAARGYHAGLYDYSPQVISIWLLPKADTAPYVPPSVFPWSGNACDLNQFLEDPQNWYTEPEEKRMCEGRNTAAQVIYFVPFSESDSRKSELHRLLTEIFLRADPDFEWLKTKGILLNTEEKEKVRSMNALLEVAYEDGMNAGFSRGIRKGEAQGIRKGEAQGIRRGEAAILSRIVRNAAKTGDSLEKISQLTGLSENEIRQLLEESSDTR